MSHEEVLLERFSALPVGRQQELLDFAEFLERKVASRRERRSLKGALSDLNIHITGEDFREARGEMWRKFSRDS